jgi:hypothetical protein
VCVEEPDLAQLLPYHRVSMSITPPYKWRYCRAICGLNSELCNCQPVVSVVGAETCTGPGVGGGASSYFYSREGRKRLEGGCIYINCIIHQFYTWAAVALDSDTVCNSGSVKAGMGVQ